MTRFQSSKFDDYGLLMLVRICIYMFGSYVQHDNLQPRQQQQRQPTLLMQLGLLTGQQIGVLEISLRVWDPVYRFFSLGTNLGSTDSHSDTPAAN